MYRQAQHFSSRRGFALLEVMIAVGLLTFAVTSIATAIVAAQQHSLEARITIVASVAAESLLTKISQEPWEIIDSWQGYTQEVGTIVDPAGIELRGDWGAIGRRVSIAETDVFIEPLQVFIMGRTVTVTVFSEDGRELTTVHRFIPEPQS